MSSSAHGVIPAWSLALVAALGGLAMGASRVDALSAADATCREFIAKRTSGLEDTALNEAVKCAKQRSLGAIAAATDCSDVGGAGFPGAAKVAKAAGKLSADIGIKCAGASTPAANGYASCPSPCDTTVPSIAGYADVASCLACLAKADVTTLVQTAYGTTPPVQGDSTPAWKCQNKDVGKSVRTYVKKRFGAQRKCQHKEDTGAIGSTDCETADLTGAIAGAGTKLATAILKCTDADLGMLTSCAATVSAEQTCVQAAGQSTSNAIFEAVYPAPVTPPCAADNFLDVSGAPGPGGTYASLKPSLSASCTSTTVTVQSNGIPTYEYEALTPNGLQAKSYTFTFPAAPTVAASTTPVYLLGNVGVTVAGMPLYAVNEGPQPASDAYGDPIAAAILDECGSHSAQQGTFHNHKLLVKCLIQSAVSSSQPWNNPDPSPSVASPIVGYAFDGFPIYGPYECTDQSCTSVQQMLSSWDNTGYQAGTEGCASSAACSNGYCTAVMIGGVATTACVPRTCVWSNNTYSAKVGSQYLDQCNGHYGPGGDYHYHATSTFPYILGCYRGTPTNNGGNGTPPGGTCP